MRTFLLLFLFINSNYSQELYFPANNDNWERTNVNDLNWNSKNLDTLINYLQKKDTKAFLILKSGKLVVEQYFDSFTADSFWYWASAGKTMTSTLIGIAEQEGLLNIQDKTYQYLGEDWTNCEEYDKEISIWNQLTMTSGLDYKVDNIHCTDPECLLCLNEPGTEWYYHNAPYTLLADVIETASGGTLNKFYKDRIASKIGMGGAYFPSEEGRLLITTPRDMARFGLMILAGGKWNEEIIINGSYYNDMINTSQDINLSYGYLWWLNGKESFRMPGLTYTFNGQLIPTAPDDLFAALGKNDQKLYIVPSLYLVVVRMGNAASGGVPALSNFDEELWSLIMNLIDINNSINDIRIIDKEIISQYPIVKIDVFDLQGRSVYSSNSNKIPSDLNPNSMYLLKAIDLNGQEHFIKYISN